MLKRYWQLLQFFHCEFDVALLVIDVNQKWLKVYIFIKHCKNIINISDIQSRINTTLVKILCCSRCPRKNLAREGSKGRPIEQQSKCGVSQQLCDILSQYGDIFRTGQSLISEFIDLCTTLNDVIGEVQLRMLNTSSTPVNHISHVDRWEQRRFDMLQIYGE